VATQEALTCTAINQEDDLVRDELLVNHAEHGAGVWGVALARNDDPASACSN
jgi:hypothetical protein